MQILLNYVKGLSASDTWMQQFMKEPKQGKIKESWSVVQYQTKNKYKASPRNITALGDTPGRADIEA